MKSKYYVTTWDTNRGNPVKASPSEIRHYEKLALERGGTVRHPVCDKVTYVTSPFVDESKLTENDFQVAVIDLAHKHGWKVAHFRKSRTKTGWRTAVAADGKGFTDLCLVRSRVVWAELKVEPNKLTPDQENWRDWLLAAGQEWYCWYPRDWSQIEAVLK